MTAASRKKKPAPSKPRSGVQPIPDGGQDATRPDLESEDGKLTSAQRARRAETMQGPATNAAVITGTFQQGFQDLPASYRIDFIDLYEDLDQQISRIQKDDFGRAEAMLIAQAHSLQAIFTHFAIMGRSITHVDNLQAVMNLAFKAQAQCRATLQTLVEVKYPRQTSFVKQQNVAVNQQVNNGTDPGASPARGETIEVTNEVLEEKQHERLEHRPAATPSPVDSRVDALAPVNGTAYSGREGQGEKKLAQARIAISAGARPKTGPSQAKRMAQKH